jgi:hypothetical protein
MTIEEAKKILLFTKFNVGNGIIWQFNETTLLINGKPLTQYNLYEENGECYLHTEHPVTTNEDYLITTVGEVHSPFKILLTPKFSKIRPVLLEQEFSF